MCVCVCVCLSFSYDIPYPYFPKQALYLFTWNIHINKLKPSEEIECV